jgi:hypothetical protein
MPSDTAWLMPELTAGAPLAKAYDGLTVSTVALSTAPKMEVGAHRLSPRDLSSTVENLRALGIDLDENNRVLRGLRAMIITNYSLYALYSAQRAIAKASAARQMAYAAAETTALAVTQQWHRIAMGGIAAGLVYAAFKTGENLGSGEWNLPSVDMKNPASRRTAARQLSTVSARGSRRLFASIRDMMNYEKNHPSLIRLSSRPGTVPGTYVAIYAEVTDR